MMPRTRVARSTSADANPDAPFARFMQQLSEKYQLAAIAERLGISRPEVSMFVHGVRPPSARVLDAFKERWPAYYRAAYRAAARQGLAVALPIDADSQGKLRLGLLLSIAWSALPDDVAEQTARDMLGRLKERGWSVPWEAA